MFKFSPAQKNVFALTVILVLTFWVFWPSLDNGFLNWDDDAYVTANFGVKDFTFQKIPRIFSSFERQQYKPLSFLCFSLEYRAFGMNPRGYHAVSVALHLVNAAFVFWLFFLLRRSVLIAFIVAVLFGVHPLRVESVAWITEQKDLLYGFFFLAASVCYLQYMIKRRRACYFASLALFIGSLFSKPMLLLFPFILFGYDALRSDDRPFSRKAHEKIPFFLISFLVAALNYAALSWYGAKHALSFSPIEWANRLSFYIQKIFWPVHLSGFYPYFPQRIHTFAALFTAVFLILFWVLFFWVFRKNKKLVFGGSLFFLSVFPVLLENGSFVVADRYVYVAALGFFYLLAEFFRVVVDSCRGRAAALKGVFSVLAVVVLGLMCAATFHRTKVWHDSLAFWDDVVRKFPQSYLALNNRGDAYLAKGEYGSAIADFAAAISINPLEPTAYVNSCNAYIFLGERDRALAFCNKAVALNPEHAVAHFNIGNIHADLGRHEEALLAYKKAVAIKSDYADAYQNMGTVYNALQMHEEAEALFKKALAIDRQSFEARYNLAVLYFLDRKYDLAIQYCDEAVRMGYQPDKDFLEVLKPYRK